MEAYKLVRGLYNKLLPTKLSRIQDPLKGHKLLIAEILTGTTKPAVIERLEAYDSEEEDEADQPEENVCEEEEHGTRLKKGPIARG